MVKGDYEHYIEICYCLLEKNSTIRQKTTTNQKPRLHLNPHRFRTFKQRKMMSGLHKTNHIVTNRV